nr:flocculation protein FLO11-like [Dermatophagoides farinae]
MEIQKIGKSTDINKQMHLSIANYAANLRQVSASDAPIKQPQTRGNRSFLLPDGGGSITDPPLPSGVPKNIPSSASRTPTPVMRPERATTPVMKPKGASVPKNIASSASKAPTPVMKPEGASVPKNIPSSASKAPTPVMKPEGASVPKNIHSSASKAPTPVMKPEGASVTKNIPSSASKAPIPVMKPEGASVPKNIHSSASKAPIPVMQPEGTSVPKNIPSASNAPIPVMQPEGTNVPKNIPSASKAPIQVMQPEGTSVPKNIPSSASSETAAILENVSPSSSVHRGGYSSATLTPASSRNSFGSDITQVLSQPTNSKIQRHSSLPDLKSTQPATIERLSKSLISVHDQQSPLSSASSTSSYLSASDGYATDSSGLVMIAGSKKPKFQANTSSSSVLGRQIDTPSLQQTSPPPPSPTAPVGNVLEQIPQMDAHTPREFVLQPPIRLDRTQSQIITGSRQTLLPKSASSPSIFYPEMDAPSPTTPVGNVLDQIPQMDTHTPREFVLQPPIRLDRTQSQIITGSRPAILQKSTSSPSIFYPEMDAPSSSTTPTPATSVDNILDQIPQMDAHTPRKFVLQPPIQLDRTQSQIITGSRPAILQKSTSSPSIFYPEMDAPSPTVPVGNVLDQIPQMDAHTPRKFVFQPPIRLDRTQSEIITGSRQAILQKSTSSPSIFYPEMDAPSSSTSTTPSPATSVDNILDQIPQMDAHTTRKYVLQPPIRLDRTQSEIITGSRETILPKSTSSPSIFYPELEAPSSSTSTPSPTPSVDNVSVSSSRPLSPALSETSDIHPSIGSNNALATTEPVNSSIDVIKDVNISRGPSFKSAKKTIEKKFAYEPRSTVVTNLDSFETRRQSIAEKMTTIVRHLFSFSGTSSYTRPVSRSTTAISPQPSPSPSSSSISTSSSSTSTPSSSTSIPDMTATTDMTRVIQELDALSKLRNLDSTP